MQTLITPKRTALGLTAAVTLGLAAAPAAQAQNENSVKLKRSGDTRLTLDKNTAKALRSLGIRVSPVSPAKASKGTVRFPITGGQIDPATGAGIINHSGGLQLRKGSTRVSLRNLRITVGSKATISAQVGKNRATVINLNVKRAKVTRPNFNTTISNVGVALNKTGASALNKAFKTKAFKSGTKLGTARVSAIADELILTGGRTEVAVDAGTLGVIAGAGIAPGVLAPATLTGTTASFPILQSKVKVGLASGTIRHSGGISLSRAGTVVEAKDFDIRLGASPVLDATVGGASPKAPILDLDLSGANTTVNGSEVTVTPVPAKVSSTLSTALTGVFALPATTGAPFGVATVKAVVK
jgi:hypothetical protein